MTTPKVTFHPYKPADLDEINLLPDEAETVRQGAAFFEQLTREPEQFCGTARRDGKLLFIGGYYWTEPGTVQVFIVPDNRAIAYPVAFIKAVMHWRRWVEGLPGAERIETFSLLTKRICVWMRRCGFACVGETTRYTEAGERFMVWRRSKVDGVWGR